jgi:putative drug exporter of the RND superfamily
MTRSSNETAVPPASGQGGRRTLSVTRRLALLAAYHPWRVVGVWGLGLVASLAVISAMLGSALTTDANITTRPDSVKASDLLARSFVERNHVDEAVVIYSSTRTVDEPAFRDFVAETRHSLRDTGATRTVSNPYAKKAPAVSKDAHAMAVLLTMGNDAEDEIVSVLDKVRAADNDPAYEVSVSGNYTLDHDFNELASRDLSKGELQIGLPAALIVLILVFGALVAALVPMAVAIVSIIVAVAVSAMIGQIASLSFFIVNMITAMGLALGIDYGLFVVSRYREQRSHGLDKPEAIVSTGGTASKAVLFSGSSFVVALLGLLLVPDTILRSLALGAIIVGLVTVVAALTLLPALLALLGDRVDALRLPFFGRKRPAESRFWTRTVGTVIRHPAVALGASVIILLAAAVPVLDLRTGTAGVSTLPDSTFSKHGFLALERSFPRNASSDPAQVVISGDAGSDDIATAMDVFEASVSDDADFGAPQRQIAHDRRVALVSIPLVGDPDSERARRAAERLRSDLVPAAFAKTDAQVFVGGQTAENIDYSALINHWLPIVLAFVLGLSLILLTVVFRSLVLSATAVALNLLSVGAAYGLLVLVFLKGHGTDLLSFQHVERVESWVPVFLFSVLFALSMDYHVFLLTRIRERYADTGDTVDAVVHGIAATGRIITGAALIIVVVFAGFATGDLVMFQQMGFGVGVALLVDATLIRMVVVPAAMTLLGDRNWYLPSWLRWLPELHVEGDPEVALAFAANKLSGPTGIRAPRPRSRVERRMCGPGKSSEHRAPACRTFDSADPETCVGRPVLPRLDTC